MITLKYLLPHWHFHLKPLEAGLGPHSAEGQGLLGARSDSFLSLSYLDWTMNILSLASESHSLLFLCFVFCRSSCCFTHFFAGFSSSVAPYMLFLGVCPRPYSDHFCFLSTSQTHWFLFTQQPEQSSDLSVSFSTASNPPSAFPVRTAVSTQNGQEVLPSGFWPFRPHLAPLSLIPWAPRCGPPFPQASCMCAFFCYSPPTAAPHTQALCLHLPHAITLPNQRPVLV